MKKITRLDKASVTAIKDCMKVKKNEKLLVITDEFKKEIGYSIYENAKRLGYKLLLLEMPSAKINGEEPPAEVADMMIKFDDLTKYASVETISPIIGGLAKSLSSFGGSFFMFALAIPSTIISSNINRFSPDFFLNILAKDLPSNSFRL